MGFLVHIVMHAIPEIAVPSHIVRMIYKNQHSHTIFKLISGDVFFIGVFSFNLNETCSHYNSLVSF